MEARGSPDAALLDYTKAIELRPRYAPAYNNRALIFATLGEKDKTFEWLEKAYADRSPGLLALKRWGFDKVRSDPRYADLLRRVGPLQ